MRRHRVRDLLAVIADERAAPRVRAEATAALAAVDEDRAVQALLAIARDEREDPPIAAVAGQTLASISFRRGDIYAVPLEDFTGAAYLAFDAALAARQKSS